MVKFDIAVLTSVKIRKRIEQRLLSLLDYEKLHIRVMCGGKKWYILIRREPDDARFPMLQKRNIFLTPDYGVGKILLLCVYKSKGKRIPC